jgi:hypothetical protein
VDDKNDRTGLAAEEEETRIFQVDDDFRPGPDGNAAIAALLGYATEVRRGKFGGKIARRAWYLAVDDRRSPAHAPEWKPCYDWCEDEVSLAEMMAARGRVFYLKRVSRAGAQKLPRFICLFDHEDGVAVTMPFLKPSYALAAALFFVLKVSSRK